MMKEESIRKFENSNHSEKKFGLFLLVLAVSFGFLLALTMVSADLGCCFDTSTGFCSPGTESTICIGNNVQFFASSSCAVSECNQGCCNLGTDFPFITARECELRAEQKGFEFSWQEMDADSCRLLSLASEEGACILGTYRDKCKISTREKCTSGDFTSNANCVDLKIYNQTENTMCYKDSVYFKDTAGNPAAIKEVCDYNAGTICKEKSANKAYCASLNCEGGRKNGESWCSFDSKEYLDIAEIYTDGELHAAPVGSRFFRKYCSNGEIVTEPCADYRMEFCTLGKCEINKGDECLLANTADKETGETKIDEESCSGEYCYMKIPMDCVEAGGQNFCGSNRDSYTKGVDAKEYASGPLESLNLPLCVPKIPQGLDFYSSSSKQLNAKGEQTSVCSYGNFESAELQFGYHGPNDFNWNLILATASAGGVGGYIGGGAYLAYDYWWGSGLTLGKSDNDWYYFPPVLGGKGYGFIALAEPIYDAWNFYGEAPPGYPWELKHFVTGSYDEIMNDAVESKNMEVSGKVLSLLGERCGVISDCAGKGNWLGGTGGAGAEESEEESGSGESMSMGGDDKDPSFKYLGYSCGIYNAPTGGDCSKCGADELSCTEYRCKAIGKGCNYEEPSGADKGYCVSSNDKSSPIIALKGINPASPVEPYTPVEISISTNEASECKFSLNNVGAKYSDMKYNFGDGFNFEHSVKLNIPGQIAGLRGEIAEYPLLTKDGKYTMYVRCLDAAGNGDTMQPFAVSFEVMKTPDNKILAPRNFNPVSGSPIKYDTTSRFITFEMLEPSECRWDFSDKTYENMNNFFYCDTSIGTNPTKNYQCSGILTNITSVKTTKYERQVVCRETASGEVCKEETVAVTSASEGKNFYIRCKDQPELENDTVVIKGISYSRNTMQTSAVYGLRNSDALKISDISPSGKVYAGLKDTFELAAFTSSGANNGIAACSFKISNKSDFSGASYSMFKSTNSTTHKQTLNSALLLGFNYVNVKCIDSAGNIAYLNSTFNLVLDKSSPKAISFSKSLDNLKIKTDESAKCYYSFDNVKKCLFNKQNGTEMQTADEYVHTAPWQNDKTFYIKCEDSRGNLAAGCTIAVDTRAYSEY